MAMTAGPSAAAARVVSSTDMALTISLDSRLTPHTLSTLLPCCGDLTMTLRGTRGVEALQLEGVMLPGDKLRRAASGSQVLPARKRGSLASRGARATPEHLSNGRGHN